jgi:hypothetical protein
MEVHHTTSGFWKETIQMTELYPVAIQWIHGTKGLEDIPNCQVEHHTAQDFTNSGACNFVVSCYHMPKPLCL